MWSWERSTGKDSRGRIYKVRGTIYEGDFQLVRAELAVSKVMKPETLTVAIFTC